MEQWPPHRATAQPVPGGPGTTARARAQSWPSSAWALPVAYHLNCLALELAPEEDRDDGRLGDRNDDDDHHLAQRVPQHPPRCALDGLAVPDLPELEVHRLTARTTSLGGVCVSV